MSRGKRGASVISVRCSPFPFFALALLLAATAPARAQVENLTATPLRSAIDATPDSTPDPMQPSQGASDEKKPVRPPPPGAKPPPPRKAGDLPPLKPYPGAQRLGKQGGPDKPTPSPTATPDAPTLPPGPTVAVPEPAPARRKIPADPNPFDPLGLRLGDIDVKPYIEQDLGYASNPLGATSSPQGSGVSTTEVGAAWQSQWLRNDFHGQLKGGYTDYFETPDASGAYGSGTIDGRLDATRDLAFDGEGRFNVLPQPLSNFGVTIPAGGSSPYIETATYGATLGAVQKFGNLSIGLHGAFDRESYQNAPLSAKNEENLSADDYDDWSLKLKTAYRVSEAVSPYFEVDTDARRYANGVDALDYQADSEGLYLLAGVTLSFSQMLNGELALGYGERSYQDPRLPRASAPLIDASLIWTATPLTTFTLKANTAINDAIIANASADINHSYSIDISHALTRQWTLGLTGTLGTDQYVGNSQSDWNWSVAAKAEYHITRDIVFKLTATHTAYASNSPGQNSTNNIVMLGVRLQR